MLALVLRCGPSYHDLEELLAERGVDVDHVTHVPAGPTFHAAASWALLVCIATPLGMVGFWTNSASSVQAPRTTSEETLRCCIG